MDFKEKLQQMMGGGYHVRFVLKAACLSFFFLMNNCIKL